MRDEKLHAVVARSRFGRQNAKNLSVGALLEAQMSKKVHAIVERSTFRSQNGTKHTRFGPLLEVEMMKKCTALWDEAHFNVKMCKVQEVGSIFGS